MELSAEECKAIILYSAVLLDGFLFYLYDTKSPRSEENRGECFGIEPMEHYGADTGRRGLGRPAEERRGQDGPNQLDGDRPAKEAAGEPPGVENQI